MNADTIEQALREFFARDPHGATAVYLLDAAVCVLLEKDLPAIVSTELRAELEALLDVEVVILNTARLEFCVGVFRSGKVIVDRDRSARLRFEVATRNEYWDFLPILQRYRAASSRRLG